MHLPTDDLHKFKGSGTVSLDDQRMSLDFHIIQSRSGSLRVHLPEVSGTEAGVLHDLSRSGLILDEVELHDEISNTSFICEDVAVQVGTYYVGRQGDFFLKPMSMKRSDDRALEGVDMLSLSLTNAALKDSAVVNTGSLGNLSFSHLDPKEAYDEVINTIRDLGLGQFTGYAHLSRGSKYELKELNQIAAMMDDYLLMLSFAQGRQIHWMSCCDTNGSLLMLRDRQSLPTRQTFECIMPRFVASFLQDSFAAFQERKGPAGLTTAINWYLTSLNSHFIEDQCIAVYTGLEWLKAHYHNEFEPDLLIDEAQFDQNILPDLKASLDKIVEGKPQIDAALKEIPDRLPHSKLDMMKHSISGLKRYSLKNSLRLLFHHYQVPYLDILPNSRALQNFTELRNDLIHQGRPDVLNQQTYDLLRDGRALMIRTVLSLLNYDSSFLDGILNQGETLNQLRQRGLSK